MAPHPAEGTAEREKIRAAGAATSPIDVVPASAAPEPTFVEAMDASTGLFNGMTVGGAAVAILLGIITLGAMQEQG